MQSVRIHTTCFRSPVVIEKKKRSTGTSLAVWQAVFSTVPGVSPQGPDHRLLSLDHIREMVASWEFTSPLNTLPLNL